MDAPPLDSLCQCLTEAEWCTGSEEFWDSATTARIASWIAYRFIHREEPERTNKRAGPEPPPAPPNPDPNQPPRRARGRPRKTSQTPFSTPYHHSEPPTIHEPQAFPDTPPHPPFGERDEGAEQAAFVEPWEHRSWYTILQPCSS